MRRFFDIILAAIVAASAVLAIGYAFPERVTYQAEPEAPAPVLMRTAVVTAYNSEEDQTDDTPFLTASGETVGEGTIACPREIPFGTRVDIAGKSYVCKDRMHPRFNDRFDIWMPNRDEAKEWGKRTLSITIHL